MCGIGGIVSLYGRPVPAQVLAEMAALQTHRGPDDQGLWYHENVGLAFRRLAIIDLSPAGHQPMCNETGDVWLVFNGEIYNYAALHEDLCGRGHRFRSRTDSEVIIHAYEEYGDACVHRFNGMFAFAIWDMRRQRLLLARDRMGVKPLYYHHSPEHLVFASEIKAVLVGAGLQPRPNDAIIFDYLTRKRLDHTDATFFAGVRQLPAAHVAVYDGRGFTTSRYWAIPRTKVTAGQTVTTAQLNDYAEQFRHLLTDSIRLRLRSDVPIGTCLSGGLDSSAIACIVRLLLNGEVSEEGETTLVERQKTFSARYRNFTSDEGPFIDDVVRTTAAEAHAVYPSGARLVAELPRLLWFQEEPFPGTSVYAQWNVMRLARAHGVTVLLDGQGSDEQLAGYYRHFGALFADRLWHRALTALVRDIFSYCAKGYPTQQAALGAAVALVGASWGARQAWVRTGSLVAPTWLNAAFRRAHPFYQLPTPHFQAPFDEALYQAMTSESLPSLLHYEDRNSMAFSIEARVPFLDYRLIEFVFSLPTAAKINGGTTKVILRRAMRGILPTSVLLRRDKVGFATPQDRWLRGPAQTLVADMLASPSLAQHGYVNPTCIGALWRRFQDGESRHADVLWRCLSLELWLRYMVDSPGWFRQHPWGTDQAAINRASLCCATGRGP